MHLKSGLLGLIAVAILASCSTGNDVVSGRNIQKRKYNDGFYIASGDKFKAKTNTVKSEEAVAVENNAAETNDVSQPLFTETETPSLNTINTEQTIPAGTSEELVWEPAVVETEEVIQTDKSVARPLNLTKNNKKVTFKPGRVSPQMIQQTIAENSSSSADVMLILLIILCFIIPPLAVFIFEGATGRFWIDLILTILGFGVGWWLLGGGLAYLCALVAVIYALLIVLSVI